MPKSNKTRKTKEVSTEKKTRRKKKEVVSEPVEDEVVEEVVEEVDDVAEDVVEDEVTETVKRTRRVVTRDSVLDDFDSTLELVDAEIESLRSSDNKTRKGTGVKFLRSLSKRLRTLRNDSSRVMKQKRTSNRPRNTQSGFMKPVSISKEMADFTGWDNEELKSRVDVTKYICQYIRDKELQNPEDRRHILPDKGLKKLLKMGKADDDLTYYSLQQKIQHHFNK